MSHLGTLDAGSRHDLHIGISPDAPDESLFKDETEGAFGYAHSYEISSSVICEREGERGVRAYCSYPAAYCVVPIVIIPTLGI